jgi:hypothetical protein
VEADAPAERAARLVRDRLELAHAISAAVARSEGRLHATKREWLLELRDEIDRLIASNLGD